MACWFRAPGLDAAEFVRRAERGLGVAIRVGQANGAIENQSEARSRAASDRDISLGRSTMSAADIVAKPKRTDFADRAELSGPGRRGDGLERPGICAMADGVYDEQFGAGAEAKDECEAGQMMDPEARAAWLEDARSRMKSPTAQQLAIVRAAFARAGRTSPEEVGSPQTRTIPADPPNHPHPSSQQQRADDR